MHNLINIDNEELKLETHKCDYGCGGNGIFYYKTANKWCCSSTFFKCQGHKDKMSKEATKRNYNTKFNKERREAKRALEAGELKCKYCGKDANYLLVGNKPCCVEKAMSCPDFGNMQRDHMLEYYKTPGAKEKARAKLRECQNRPKVKAAKKVKMIVLHKGNCEPCIEFQEKYQVGIAKRKRNTKIRQTEYLISKGYDCPADDKERADLVNKVRSKYRYREMLSSSVDINTNIEGDI